MQLRRLLLDTLGLGLVIGFAQVLLSWVLQPYYFSMPWNQRVQAGELSATGPGPGIVLAALLVAALAYWRLRDNNIQVATSMLMGLTWAVVAAGISLIWTRIQYPDAILVYPWYLIAFFVWVALAPVAFWALNHSLPLPRDPHQGG